MKEIELEMDAVLAQITRDAEIEYLEKNGY
jgi:hypothetical protein